MPHKHKRARDANTADDYDLPPTTTAKPLPVRSDTVFTKSDKKSKKQRKPISPGYAQDDTPKAFARLMAFQSGALPKRSALDNGDGPARGRKRKRNEKDGKATNETVKKPVKQIEQAKVELPTIKPGESMSDFRARVDHALPVSGLIGKGKKIEGIKEHRTKHEKRLLKLQSDWRKEEARIREKEEEEKELEEERAEEEAALYGTALAVEGEGTTKRKKRKKKMLGEQDDGEDDPWAVLKAKRTAPTSINDVVQAPPTFSVVPKEKFKIKNGAKVDVQDVPNIAGSLRRREELGVERKDVIASYRAMMKEKRAGE